MITRPVMTARGTVISAVVSERRDTLGIESARYLARLSVAATGQTHLGVGSTPSEALTAALEAASRRTP